MESITLYFRQGSSDKVYQASIRPEDGGYRVHFAYGRRGTTLTTGTKTPESVNHAQAKIIFDRLVREKTAKGYTPGEDGTPYQSPAHSSQATGIQCQLLNPVNEDQIDSLLSDHAHWMQEKIDGRRLLLRKDGGQITGINRRGLAIDLPQTLVQDASQSPHDFLLDGEAVGDTLHVFDLLAASGQDLRPLAFSFRFFRLQNLLESFEHPHLQLVSCHVLAEKQAWFLRFKAEGKEGVVFKHVEAPYTGGRPASGGTQLKLKFHETASFVVSQINAKRSVSLMLWDKKQPCCAGNVTIPPNHEIPKLGEVVECRYLYAFKESGSIYQPVFLGRRDDITPDECTTSQLKFKAEAGKMAA